MTVELLQLPTQQSFQCIPITEAVRAFIAKRGGQDGAVLISGQHTTTAVVINEMEERLIEDLKAWLAEVAPANRAWKHNDLELRPNIPADEPRNAHAHLQALLLGNQVMVTVENGGLVLGQYQDVILVELDGPRQRKVALQWLASPGSA